MTLREDGALGDSLGPRARAHWAHSFVGPEGPGPIGPFLGDSSDEVISFSHIHSEIVLLGICHFHVAFSRHGFG